MPYPKPVLMGSVRSRPLAPLLVALLDAQRSGTLVVEEPTGAKSAVTFAAGVPAKARSAEPVVHLGRLLVEMGAIDGATHDATLRQVAEHKRLHGQILLGAGAIDQATLEAALREQVARRVESLFRCSPEAVLGFYEGVDFLERWGRPELTPVNALALIWRAINNQVDADEVRQAVDELGSRPLVIHPRAEIARFGLVSPHRETADLLRARALSVSELLAMSPADEDAVTRLVYALVLTRHVDAGTGSTPVGVAPSNEPPPSAGRVQSSGARPPRVASASDCDSTDPSAKPTPSPSSRPSPSPDDTADDTARQLRQQLTDLARRHADLDHYQVLGVDRSASSDAIQAAFFDLAKKWHPDRLPASSAELRSLAGQVFARMTEARQTLMDAERRRAYDVSLDEPAPDSEQQRVARVLEAAMAFQRAEVLMKKRAYPAAEAEARRALALDPEQADYVALVAWIESHKTTEELELNRLIEALNGAVRRDSNNARIRHYRAQLLKRAGLDARAIQDFRWIAEHDPRDVDAQRELRLYSMRHREEAPASGRAGGPSLTPTAMKNALGKLFKR
ncbi:MAG: J domain-containing protein [Polyangiaceae bacterium]|nr:J domain-containing protein [Polyangiaceae bacterium]